MVTPFPWESNKFRHGPVTLFCLKRCQRKSVDESPGQFFLLVKRDTSLAVSFSASRCCYLLKTPTMRAPSGTIWEPFKKGKRITIDDSRKKNRHWALVTAPRY
jgi:hypothetical protein